MFLTISRYSTAKTGKYVKELSLSFPQLKTELKNWYWFVFCSRFWLGRLPKNCSFFLGHIAISQPILKIMSWNSAHELSLILWSQIWTHMSNIKSLWRHGDVIFEKSVKRWASSAQNHVLIYQFRVTNYFLCGRCCNYSMLFNNVFQKSKIFER